MFEDVSGFQKYLPEVPPTSLQDLDPRLRMFQDDKLEIWYAPLSSSNLDPKLWILGITPGWNQMRIAYQLAAEALHSGLTSASAVAMQKPQVAFAGAMRQNLVGMLDDLGFPEYLGVNHSIEIFGSSLLKTGSALKYPVFRGSKNYTGSSPSPTKHVALRAMLETVLVGEIERTAQCMILPLGKSVELMLAHLVGMGKLTEERILRGFPHPSGANGHRVKQFARNRSSLRAQVAAWYAKAG